jgi:hypothetical protein
MKRPIALLSLTLCATVSAQNAGNRQKELTLDIVPYRDVVGVEVREPPRPRVSHSGPYPQLSATLLPLTRDEFWWGEEFEFQLRVRNVGTLPVTLPWTADGMVPPESDHATAHVHSAAAYIQIESRDGQRRLGQLSLQMLAGAATTPGSLQVLRPGETALLRIPATWSSDDGDAAGRVLGEPGGRVRIRGVFNVWDVAVATSSNAIDVLVMATR